MKIPVAKKFFFWAFLYVSSFSFAVDWTSKGAADTYLERVPKNKRIVIVSASALTAAGDLRHTFGKLLDPNFKTAIKRFILPGDSCAKILGLQETAPVSDQQCPGLRI